MIELSILVPSRNEEWLAETLADLIKNKNDVTEIIVVIDGEEYPKELPTHKDLTIIKRFESRGQRASTNEAARIARGKYIMKTDAHTAWDKDFDLKIIQGFKDLGDDVTQVPIMRNLHVFDWRCANGHRRYQGPSGTCPICRAEEKKEVIWYPKPNPESTSYRFDHTLHFQYMREWKKSEEYRAGAIVGFELFFDFLTVPPLVIQMLADLASSHKFFISSDNPPLWEHMSSNAVSFPSVDVCGSIRASEVISIADKLNVDWIATSSILTDMVDYRDVTSSPEGQGSNNPGIHQSMCKGYALELGATSIASTVDSAHPVPTTTRVINGDFIDKLNNILGGQFVYSEISKSFHNGSVTLTPIRDKRYTESMSIQGSCFVLSKDKYWELNICDEEFGSWGQQGVEVACKTWLSGGRVIINHNTWYGHLFRTQGGDFSFPYKQDEKKIEAAREYSRKLFLDNKWPLQKYPLSWLLAKFAPVPDWHNADNGMLKRVEEWGKRFKPMI